MSRPSTRGRAKSLSSASRTVPAPLPLPPVGGALVLHEKRRVTRSVLANAVGKLGEPPSSLAQPLPTPRRIRKPIQQPTDQPDSSSTNPGQPGRPSTPPQPLLSPVTIHSPIPRSASRIDRVALLIRHHTASSDGTLHLNEESNTSFFEDDAPEEDSSNEIFVDVNTGDTEASHSPSPDSPQSFEDPATPIAQMASPSKGKAPERAPPEYPPVSPHYRTLSGAVPMAPAPSLFEVFEPALFVDITSYMRFCDTVQRLWNNPPQNWRNLSTTQLLAYNPALSAEMFPPQPPPHIEALAQPRFQLVETALIMAREFWENPLTLENYPRAATGVRPISAAPSDARTGAHISSVPSSRAASTIPSVDPQRPPTTRPQDGTWPQWTTPLRPPNFAQHAPSREERERRAAEEMHLSTISGLKAALVNPTFTSYVQRERQDTESTYVPSNFPRVYDPLTPTRPAGSRNIMDVPDSRRFAPAEMYYPTAPTGPARAQYDSYGRLLPGQPIPLPQLPAAPVVPLAPAQSFANNNSISAYMSGRSAAQASATNIPPQTRADLPPDHRSPIPGPPSHHSRDDGQDDPSKGASGPNDPPGGSSDPPDHREPGGSGGGGAGGYGGGGWPPVPPGGGGGGWPPMPPNWFPGWPPAAPPPGGGGGGNGGGPPGSPGNFPFGGMPPWNPWFPMYYPAPQAPISRRPKAREPDRFDGSNPKKIKDFILQCILYFQSDPVLYQPDRTKVFFALTYLEGYALSHFSPFLMMDPLPPVLLSWEQFVRSLNQQFGDRNVQRSAQLALDGMKMKEHFKANKHIVQFFDYADVSGYNDAALSAILYKSLPDRLQDEVSRCGRPEDLSILRHLILDLDGRYWEREHEKTVYAAQSGGSSSKTNSRTRSDDTRGKSASDSSKTAPSSTHSEDRPRPQLSQEERKRREDLKQCFYCGTKLPKHSHDCKSNHASNTPENRQPAPSGGSSSSSRTGRSAVTVELQGADATPSASIEDLQDSCPTPPPGN